MRPIPSLTRLMLPLAATVFALILSGCTTPAPQSGEQPTTAGSVAQPAAPTAPTPSPPSPPLSPLPPPAPPAPEQIAGESAAEPTVPDRSCRSDSDCAVKDIGSCCGYLPMCVNKNAQTNPAAVRAACEKNGVASICGFQEVKGCSCVQGRCENLSDDTPVVM